MNEQSEEPDQSGQRQTAKRLLTTSRLILRTPGAEDAPALVELANNRLIAEQTRRMPHPYTRQDAEDWIALMSGAQESGEAGFVATRRDGGAIVGAAGYMQTEDQSAELGYWIGEPYWGSGYATEAAQAVIDHAFSSGALNRIVACCRVTNSASRRVLEKCGFQYVGPGMCDSRSLCGLVPAEDFVLERSVWGSLKRWGKAS